MFFHPSHLLFMATLLMSVLLALSTNSFFTAWIMMEVNLLVFIPLTLKKNKYSTESAFKYFLIQAASSLIFILSTAIYPLNQTLAYSLSSLALLIKMGAAPFHQWGPSTAEGLYWGALLTMLSAQKLTPLMLLSFTHKESYSPMLYLFIFSSAMVGSIGGISHTSLRKIVTYSSIGHLAWIMASYGPSTTMWLTYFFFYALILTSIVLNLHFLQAFILSQLMMKHKLSSSVLLSSSLLSLGGLPPFTGFIPKFMVARQLLSDSLIFTVTPLLTSTLISLFFYARIMVTMFLTSNYNTPGPLPNKMSALLSVNLIGLLGPSIMFFYSL